MQTCVLADEFVALDGVLDGDQQLLPQPRLDDEPIDFALVDGVNHRVETQHGGDENARRVGLNLAGLGEQFQAGHRRHALVADNDGKLPLAELFERGGGVGCGDHVITLAAQGFAEGHQDDVFVVHHQQAVLGRVRFRR